MPKGGKREGSGRPTKETKAYCVRCYPEQIKEIREFAKQLMKDYESRRA